MIRNAKCFTVFFTILLITGSCKKDSSVTGGTDAGGTDEDTPSVATSIEITPDIIDLDHHGGTEEVMAVVKDQFGEEITGLPLTWSVEDEEIALVDSDGIVTGIKPGSTILTVTHDTLSAEVEVNTLLQMNNQCSELGPFPSPGAFGGNVSFTLDETSMPDQVHPYITTSQKTYDFDGDGDEDILLFAFNTPAPGVEQGGKVLVWRNENGSFKLRTEEVLEPDHVRADAPRQFEVADFNNDGILDLFAAQHGWDTHPFPGAPNLLFLSDGSGGITEKSAENISPYVTDGFSHASASGDVDCDQDIDIVVSNLGDELGEQLTTRLFLNDGSANFQQTEGPMPSGMNESFLSATMCEIDRDGDLDLFLGGWPTPGVDRSLVLINNGFGEFRLPMDDTPLPPIPYSEGNHIVDATCVDVDLDGWNDLVMAATRDYQGARLVIWRNLGDGTGAFEDVTDEWAPNDWSKDWIFRAYVADFNGDGWPDFFTSGYPHNQQQVFLNTAGNGFVTQPSPLSGELHIIDANNDGKTDLFTTDHAIPTELYISN